MDLIRRGRWSGRWSASGSGFGRVCAVLLGLIGLSAADVASADTVTLTATRDATIYSESNTHANGQGDYLHVGRSNGGNRRRALVAFNIASIPSGSTITSATLTLRMDHDNDGANQNITTHRVTQTWTEGPSDGGATGGSGVPAQTNDVTWQHRTYTSLTWSTLGGTFTAGASATTAVPSTVGSYTWSGAGMVADVQAWVNGTTNNGWLLRGNEATNQTARRISSRNNPTSAERPKLTVVFTPPASTGACCASSGTCSLVTSAACTGAGSTYQGNGTSCSPNPCPQPTGACCQTDALCAVLNPGDCAAIEDSVYIGNGTVCSPNPCQFLVGACCLPNAICTTLSYGDCDGQGTFQGYATACFSLTCPWVLAPYVDALPIPPVAQPTTGTVGGAAHYDIYMTQFQQQLHRDLPPTTVWGYNGTYPGPTIEARTDHTVTVNWVNDLRDFPGGPHRVRHLLTVDTCLHGPNVTGQVPYTVVHLHGAHVRPESDGDPDAAFPPGQMAPLYEYPNKQRSATMWYHDHALGLTRLNVYMGLAGFYFIRDAAEEALDLPSGEFEIPLVFQDRSFNPNGSLKYNTVFSDQFFGDFILVNGKVWPYLEVKQGKYRFRLLNGSNTRTYTLVFPGTLASPRTWQIGSDLGLLPAPVPITSITLMPGERADVIVNFEGISPLLRFPTLTNTAVVPFPAGGGGPSVSRVMQFRIRSDPGYTERLPTTLVPVPPIPESEAVVTRTFELAKVFDPHCAHDLWLINGLLWDDITEFPVLGSTEIWSWINRSGISHPMHVHLVSFQVLDRQDFTVGGGGEIIPTGPRITPPPGERGWKDTVQATPNQITRTIMRFENYPGLFPYHCHILDHEDHEMMRMFRVVCQTTIIDEQPASTTVQVGQTAQFTVEATGSGPFTYQWRRQITSLLFENLIDGSTAAGSTIVGATGPVLSIVNAQASDTRRYLCRVTDLCGNAISTSIATLTVNPAVCPADFNQSGTLSVQDIFDFLAAFFANDPSADFNQSGNLSVQDIFDFLAAYFTGCP